MLQLIGVLIAFILIIVLIRFKVNFGFSLIIGGLILGVFSLNKIGYLEIIRAISKGTIYSFDENILVTNTVELAILMTLIYMLAKMMQETGAITQLIDSLRTIFAKGGTLGIIPAVYGLMPIPGGALFSAPVVKEEGKEFNIPVDRRNFFNIWFRHIWFPVYPISFTIITTAEYANIKLTSLIKGNFLSFIVMIIIGIFLLNFFVNKNSKNKTKKKIDLNRVKDNCHKLIFLLPPIIPVSFAVFHYVLGIDLELCFIFGVLMGIILLLYLIKTPRAGFKSLFKKSLTWRFAAIIIGIMIFREIFEVTKSNLAIFNVLQNFNIPVLFIVIVLPLILGFVSGYLLIGITLSYPLVSPFFPNTGLTTIGFASLIFMSAFVGYLISPIHLCNVLSSNYLKTETIKMYPVFVPASFVLLIIHIFIVLWLF